MTYPEIANQVLSATAITSFWILVMFATRKFVTRHLGARWTYRAWSALLIATLALAIPGFQAQNPILSNLAVLPKIGDIDWLGLMALAGDQVTVTTQSPGFAGIPLIEILVIVWLCGFLLSLLISVVRSSLHHRALIAGASQPTPEQYSQIQDFVDELDGVALPPIRITQHRTAPCVSGCLKPTLLLTPKFFSGCTRAQQLLVLTHELRHIARFDLFWLSVARVLRSVFWFNPLVYPAEYRFREDMELSCDEAVVANTDASTRKQYGEALIELACPQRPVRLALYSSSFGFLRERTQMLKIHQPPAKSRVVGSIFLFAVLGSSLTFGLSEFVDPQPNSVPPSLAQSSRALTELIETAKGNEVAIAEIGRELNELESELIRQDAPDSDIAELANLRAYMYYTAGDTRQAIEALEKVLLLHHAGSDYTGSALLTLGQMYLAQGDYHNAHARTDELAELLGTESNAVILLRAQLYFQTAQYEEASEYLNRYMERFEEKGEQPPENVSVLNSALSQKLSNQ